MADTKIIIQQPSAEEKEAFRRRTIEMADRSFVNERLNVMNLPEHLHGEWIGTDDFSQYHAQMKGFVDGSEFLGELNRLHETSTGSTVGDVKFMVIPKWKHEIYTEAMRVEAERRSGLKSVAKDDEYKSRAQAESLGVIDDERSTARTLSGTELQNQIKG